MSIHAQEKTFYHFGKNEGLSQQSIQSIVKDEDGFIWVGTQEGLNRFDGRDFKIFKTDFEDSKSICGNDIEKLLEFKNYIFVGSKNNGICYYDKKLKLFFKTSVSAGTCTSFARYNNQIFSVILNDGLYKTSYKEFNFSTSKVPLNINGNISSLYTNSSLLYIGTDSGFIYSYNIKNTVLTEIVEFRDAKNVHSLFVDDNLLWIGTNMGLYVLKDMSNKPVFVAFNHYKSFSEKLTINKISKSKDTFFIASDNGMFLLNNFNKKNFTFDKEELLVGDKNSSNTITSNRVYDFLIEKDYLWIGTNKLDVLLLKKSIFNKINTKSKPKISNNHIYSIYKTDKYLFVGTRNGLNIIDSNGNTTVITKENSNLAFNVIRDINLDKNNNLWIATTKGISIIKLNSIDSNALLKSIKITSIYHQINNTNSLSNNNTRNVFIDENNNIWISTYGGGINLFSGDLSINDFSFKRFVEDKSPNSLSSNFTFGMNKSNNNTYWISTENGLNKLVFNDGTFKTPIFKVYNKNILIEKGLKSNSILTTHIDQQDNNILWVGTEKGLHKFNIAKENFQYFGENNGLSNTVIYAILEDENHFLWVTTNDGIFHFNKKTSQFVHYNTHDGLMNAEYNLGGDFYDNNNKTIYFGGTKGVEFFNPHELINNHHQGKLIFTDLRVKDKEIFPVNSKILDKSIETVKNIHLKYNDFPAKIKFTDIQYTFPQGTEFVYKLLPDNEDWNSLKTQNEIQFLNLKAGDYTLLVQGKEKGKSWTSKPLSLQISISPPWYKSLLAYLIYTLTFTALLLFISRNIYLRKLEHQEVERLKEIGDLKTKLYANITHEFRTPITVILGMAESIKEKIKDTKISINQPIELIERNGKNLLNLVNQILDLSKLEKGKLKLNLENGNIIEHLRYLTESYHSFADEKGINLVFYNEIDRIVMDFDSNKITQIMSNLISNAVKFCNHNDKIVIHVKEKENNLIIKVKDTGMGISPENLPFIFDRFYQAENNLNKKHDGTGIGLALTKELVKLMDGTIQVKSQENKGTTFTISIPKTQKSPQNTNKQIPIKIEYQGNNYESLEEDVIENDLPICLLVEDNADVATYIKMCIEDQYQVLYANNGEKGIEMAMIHIPDIIISDIMMPIKNGFELCKTVKEDVKTNHIPVILLTAKTGQEDRISGLKLGADAYLTKPFNKEELLIRVKKLIDIRLLLQNKYQDASEWILDKKPKIQKNNKNDAFISKVLLHIEENLEDSTFSPNKLSELLFLSESQLYRKLKALTNTSTSLFIRKAKLQKAKQLLEDNKMSISEVCYSTGFNNPSWFSKVFKKEFGFSPSEQSEYD